MRLTRAEIVDPNEVAIFHTMTRTTRRCFLFGDDPLTGKNFDHRKAWIEEALQHQASAFGIDLLVYSVLSNHFHLILRSRPDVVATWDDSEVARRWLLLCPLRRDDDGQPLTPTEPELNSIRNCPVRIAEVRSRLSNISWWMRLLNQRIAQRANREDDETGRFFQDRFKAVKLLDEAAVLACAAYVDLNPIRAAMAETLEASDFTSVQRRIETLLLTANDDSNVSPVDGDVVETQANTVESISPSKTEPALTDRATMRSSVRGDWHISPIDLQEALLPPGPQGNASGTRCSDKGFLPFSLEHYLELLDWTARQLASGKRGSTPAELAPVLERLGLTSSVWCELVADFGKLFKTVAGNPFNVDNSRSRRTHRRFRISRRARDILAVEA